MPRFVIALCASLAIGACGSSAAPPDAGDASTVADTPAPDACTGAAPSRACPLCRATEFACTADGLATRRCNDDGAAFGAPAPCTAGQLCAEGACVDPCAWAAENHSYQGCEFWAVGTLNSNLGHNFDGTTRDDFPFAVALTNAWPVPVRVTLSGGGLPAPSQREIAPRGSLVVPLPWRLGLAEGGDRAAPRSTRVRDGAVHIAASAPVSAYQFNPFSFVSSPDCDGPQCYSYSNDASLLLPVAALRASYVVVSRATVRLLPADGLEWTSAAGFVAIVATAPGPTEVTVRLRSRTEPGDGIAAGTPGAVITQRLNAGDVLQLLSPTARACATPERDTIRGDVYCQPVAAEDLTGSVVESTAPVAVFAGHDCALVPYNRYACDHLEEQLFPTESLGQRYLLARTPPAGAEPDLARFVATRDGTVVTFDPPDVHPSVTLAAGESVEFEQRASFLASATQPVLAAQFLVGADYDPSRPDTPVGDPDMILTVPIDQYRGAYAFVAAAGFPDTVAIAAVPHGQPFTVDDVVVAGAPAHTAAGYDVFYLHLAPGTHRAAAVAPGIRFGLTVSGLAAFTSYSYPAGLDLAPIAAPR